jgi:hypothetical protein
MKILKTIENHTFSADEIEKPEYYQDSQKNPDPKCRFIALLMLAEKMNLSKVPAKVCGLYYQKIR